MRFMLREQDKEGAIYRINRRIKFSNTVLNQMRRVMMSGKKMFFVILILMFALALSGCNGEDVVDDIIDDPDDDVVVRTELTVANVGDPPTLDVHLSTAQLTTDCGRPIYESLFALNEEFLPEGDLADDFEFNDDGTELTIYLREGVLFHNGKEMIAEDVTASMERWVELSVFAGPILRESVWEEVDDYTVLVTLPAYDSTILYDLASTLQFAGIMPKEVVEDAPAEGVEEYIGTGPFKFVEWRTDQHIHYQKFEDYQPSSKPSSGLVGFKEALVDDLYILSVPDEGTRVAGLETGDYDIGASMGYDTALTFEDDPALSVEVTPWGFGMLTYNKTDAFFGDQRARKAVDVALNRFEIGVGAYADEALFVMNPSLVIEDSAWHTTAGGEDFDVQDQERAMELLEEIGYDGEVVQITVSDTYAIHFDAAHVIQDQLSNIGMNVELVVLDWATMLDVVATPEDWQVYVTSWPYQAHPAGFVWLDSRREAAGWTDSPEMDVLIDEIRGALTIEEAVEIYPELQREFWNYLPVSIFPHHTVVDITRANVEGYQYLNGMTFWNVEVTE